MFCVRNPMLMVLCKQIKLLWQPAQKLPPHTKPKYKRHKDRATFVAVFREDSISLVEPLETVAPLFVPGSNSAV